MCNKNIITFKVAQIIQGCKLFINYHTLEEIPLLYIYVYTFLTDLAIMDAKGLHAINTS